MKQLSPRRDWPPSWRTSFDYDQLELYGKRAHLGYTYAYANRRDRTLQLLKSAGLPAGATVLDVAAAQGNFSLLLAEMGFDVTWNDLREELADYVRLKHEAGRVSFVPGNIFELSFPQRFDAILATEVIEHVAHPDDFLRRLRELARPDGCIIVTTPNGRYFRNTLPPFSQITDPAALEAIQFRPDADGHLFLLRAEELQDLAAKAGLQVEKLLLFTNSLTIGHVKLEPMLRVLPRRLVETLERASSALPTALSHRLLVHLGARLRPL
ncbi:MAG TPA: methyltransferase domain-containing protein [Steroidobacteraceae bacterium]|nr:methyltransferase domain-containing protein [Steroidobacteraceae bacterium]